MCLSDGLCLCIQCFAVLCLVGLVLMAMLRRMKVRNYENKHVLITGCSKGFGYLLAKRLDSLGFKVFAGCRSELDMRRLKKECSSNVMVVEIDVSKKESVKRAREVVDKYLPKDKGLWAVVNNAGIASAAAPTEWLTYEDFEHTIAVNLMGVIYVTKSFLPLVRKEEGRIVNMSSMCGRMAIATAPYSAAKFGVQGFTDTLRHELYRTGCSVSLIEPGYFSTGIVDDKTIRQGLDERFESLDEDVKQYYGAAYKDQVMKQATDFVSLVMSPHVYKVIDSYEHAITSRFPKARYTVGWDAHFILRFLIWVPDWFTDFGFGFLQTRPAAKC